MVLQRPTDQNNKIVERMIEAAEELFAERGHENVSLRQLTSHAGVNVAAVNYYFGSKELLVEAVFERLAQSICAQRELALEQLQLGKALDLENIVRSFIEPYLGEGYEKQGALLARFLMRNRLYPTEGTQRIVQNYLDPIAKKYIKAFAIACPNSSNEQLTWRYLYMTNTLAASCAGDSIYDRVEALSEGRIANDQTERREELIHFLVGAFRNT